MIGASVPASPMVLEFDLDRLQTYLRRAIPGLEGPMRLARIGGG